MILKILGVVLFTIPVAGATSLAVIIDREAPTEAFTVPEKIEVNPLERLASRFRAPSKVTVKELPPAPVAKIEVASLSQPEEYLSGKIVPVLRPMMRPALLGANPSATSHSLRPRMRSLK